MPGKGGIETCVDLQLHYLMANAGPPIPHAQLLHAVWGAEFVAQVEYLRTYMRQLRQKLEDEIAHPAYLLTEPYFGYRFVSADKWYTAKYLSGAKLQT
jgi:two-component system KDP operon response regulator KdpE